MADRKPKRWVYVKTRTPKPPKEQDFAPVLFCLKDNPNPVCAGRYFPDGREFRSLQGRGYEKRKVLAWQWIPDPPRRVMLGQR